MSSPVYCPACQAPVSVEALPVGATVVCPHCQAPVPTAPTAITATAPADGETILTIVEKPAPAVRHTSSAVPCGLLVAILGGLAVVGVGLCGGLLWLYSLRGVQIGQRQARLVQQRPTAAANNPAPVAPAPLRPAFDDKFARPIELRDNRFEVRTSFDTADPFDRWGEHCAKIYQVKLGSDQAYYAEMKCHDLWGEPLLRLEDRSGEMLARGSRRDGQSSSEFIFVPAKTDSYRLVVSAARPMEFSLSVRRVQEEDVLPNIRVIEPVPARSMQVARQLGPYLAAAIAPDARSAWVTRADQQLERIACPDFSTTGKWKLPKRCYRIAVDGQSLLYAAAQLAQPRPSDREGEFALADLEIYDTRKLGAAGGQLTPVMTIAVRGVLTHLCLSPDDRWLYFLDVHNRKVGRINLREQKLDGENDQVAPGTNALCLTPDGKKLYTCSKENVVQVLDPATLKIERTLRFEEANPNGIQATDQGYVFLNSGNLQSSHIYALNAGRDYAGGRCPVVRWVEVYQSHALALAPDQRCLFSSCFSRSEGSITVYALAPSRPTMVKGRACGHIAGEPRSGSLSDGQMVVSRDGEFLMCDRGQVVSLGR